MSERQLRYFDKRKKKGWKELRVWVPPELKKQLEKETITEGVSLSQLLREILANHFKEKEGEKWKKLKTGMGMKITPRKKKGFSFFKKTD
jgi:uncharacterized protein YpmB